MPQPCQATRSHRGIFIETFSGNKSGPICDIGTRSDLMHIVKITNLMLYPADITCQGHVSSPYKLVRFLSPIPTDNSHTWKGQKRNLAYGPPYSFGYVSLLSNIPGGGKEMIDLSVIIDWHQPRTQATILLTIMVNA